MKILILISAAMVAISAIRTAMLSGPTSNNTILLAFIATALAVYGWFFNKFRKMRWLTITIVAVFISMLSFSVILAVYGRRATADYTEDVVIVLGGGIRQGEIRPTLQMRLDQAITYHQRNPAAWIVVSGGTGYGEVKSEAEYMAEYLIVSGVPAAQILLEDASVSTYTNMRYTRAVLDAHFDTPPRAVVVTSDFHMYRSARFAAQLGIDATTYPASTPLLRNPFYYVREMAAVIKMWVIGR